VERETAQIHSDFPDNQEAYFLAAERIRAGDKAHYEHWRKKVIYHHGDDAYRGYMDAQREAMERHRWYLSEKQGGDVGELSAAQDWLNHHAAEFRDFWKRTHTFTVDFPPPLLEQEQHLGNDFY